MYSGGSNWKTTIHDENVYFNFLYDTSFIEKSQCAYMLKYNKSVKSPQPWPNLKNTLVGVFSENAKNVISKSNRRYLNGPDKEHYKLGIRVGDKEMAKTLNKYFMSLLTAEEINVRNNGEAKIY